ncbi:Prefoldin alpha subunit [Canariomyces notabilis]|uniref:Prefoldin alpha subunit n=1 Tax=Canariomyces notabilis TaxID=2074819 RepID=A0AAN6TNG8_9PEZI|nr:Prefoldin alpha subunit [Canariomyces arenarius]
MASRGGQQQGGETVSLDTLSAQQLSAVKKQLDEEVEHLSTSYAQLAAAQAKFKECLRIVKTGGLESKTGEKPVLVPLTNSLYVKGQLADSDRVLVDVGTGFYVEKDTKSATEFYEAKVKELAGNIQGLEAIVQGKTNNLRVVEEVLRQKVLASSASASGGQSSSSS